MGIRGFIRNTVKAIRRFFNGPEAESNLADDANSIQHIDETPTAEEIIVEETVTEEVITEEVAVEGATIEAFVVESATPTLDEEIDEPEDVVIPDDKSLATQVSSPVALDLAESPDVDSTAVPVDIADDLVDNHIEISVIELATPTLDEEIDDPEDIAIPDDEALATQVSSLVALDLAESPDVDSLAVPVDSADDIIVDDLADSYLTIDELDDSCSNDAILDEELWPDNGQDDNFVESLPPFLEKQRRKPRRKLTTAAVELDILNYSVDIASGLDDNSIDQRPIQDISPEVPRHKKVAEIVELDILNYSVDTADETEAYLNKIIFSDDLSKEEVQSRPPEYVNQFDDSRGIYVQSGGEKVALISALESLLFVAERPVDVAHLAKILGRSTEEITLGLQTLDQSYTEAKRGLRIQDHEDKFQLVTAPSAASVVEDFLSFNLSTKLSGPALEALAVVAYRQPVTRAQVEAVRGVDCASVLRSLIQLGLIEESGRLEALGRPILYSITDLFMQHFGLLKMSELPPLEIKEEDLLLSTTELSEP